MNTTELVTRVKEVVKDGSFSDAEILGHLNRCLQDVAYENCLPGLDETDELSLEAGDDSVALPDDFSHDLWHVEPLDKTQAVNIHASLKSLQRLYGDNDTGSTITDAAQDGVSLHVRPTLTEAQDIRVHYYRAPEALVLADSTATPAIVANSPEGIPAHLHDALFVSYAAWQIFSIIEDGVDGAKVNTNHWQSQYFGALKRLQELPAVKNAPRFRPYIKRHPRYF